MATLVLGAVGATIGFYAGGPAGAYKGFMIGSAVGSVVDQSLNAPHMEANKLSDLRMSGSSYGASIPRVWGKHKVGGNIIWAATDAQGNHLVQHSKTTSNGGGGGSGGMGGSTTSYWYTATFAVAVCAGSLTMPDGSIVDRNVRLKRIWADDRLVYDDSKTGLMLSLGTSLFWYPGSESQSPSPIIQAKMGAGNTPAYRGTAYFVVQDMNLQDFSNRVPNFVVEVWSDDDGLGTGHMSVGTIISDVARQTGLAPADIDVTLATATVTGFLEAQRSGGDQTIQSLLTAFLIDLVEVDGDIKAVPRGGAPALVVSSQDLGARMGGTHDENARYTRTRALQTELPGRLDITYADTGTTYEQAVQSDIRQSANVQNVTSINLPIAMDATTARRMACSIMDSLWIGIETYRFNLPWRYLSLIPSDVVTFPTANGNVRLRITEMAMAPVGELRFSAVLDGSNVVTQSAVGQTGVGGGATSLVPVPSLFHVWSGTELRDEDQNAPGFYVAATGTGANASQWVGGAIHYSLDGGASWTQGPTVVGASIFGTATTVLGSGGAVAGVFDNANTVSVDVSGTSGQLYSTSDANIAAGNNQALVGKEVLGFGTATLGGGAGLYTLSHLKRGERASVMTGHLSGEPFVLLTNNLVRVSVPDSAVGTAVQVKVVSKFQTLDDVAAKAVTIQPRTQTKTEAILATVLAPHWIAPTTVLAATGDLVGDANEVILDWTTVDLSAFVPLGAKAVTLEWRMRELDSLVGWREILCRAGTGGTVYTVGSGSIDSVDGDFGTFGHSMVPLSPSSASLDFRITGKTLDEYRVRVIAFWM